jgi:hypothetical protein
MAREKSGEREYDWMLAGHRQWIWLAAVLAVVMAAVIWPMGAVVQAASELSGPETAAGAFVVRGKVVAQESFWSADGSQIESRSTVAVRYTLGGGTGAPAGQVAVHTVGGQLSSGLRMAASHLPALAPGEEVILFLQRSPLAGEKGYKIADERGKFTVRDGRVVVGGAEGTEGTAGVAALGLGDFYRQLQGAGLATALPADWQAREQAPFAVAGGEAGATAHAMSGTAREYTINGYKWPIGTVTYKVNINTAQASGNGSTGNDSLGAIRRAANTWTYVDEADISLVYGGPTSSTRPGFNGANEIMFVNEGAIDEAGNSRPLATTLVFYMHDTIIEADIKVNDAYTWSAAGTPPAAAYDLQSVLLHEMGHLLGLGHDENAAVAMFDSMAPGTIKWGLHDNDRRGVAAIYPCAAGEVCNPETAPEPPFALAPEVVPPPADAPLPTPAPVPAAPATPDAPFTATPPLPPEQATPGGVIYLPLVQGGS